MQCAWQWSAGTNPVHHSRQVGDSLSNNPDWVVDVGEIYRFVRYMGRAEYQKLTAPERVIDATASAHPSTRMMMARKKQQQIIHAATYQPSGVVDRAYIVASVDSTIVIAPAETFSAVPAANIATAESTYWRQVEMLRQDEAARAAQADRREQTRTLQEIRKELEEIKRQQKRDAPR